MIKLLGALLLVGYFLRCAGARRGRPAAADAAVAGDLHDARAAVADARPATSGPGLNKTLRYLLFAAFSFLVVQLVAVARAAGHAAARARALLDGGGAVRRRAASSRATSTACRGPIGEANDFAYLLASVLPFAVYLTSRDRRCADVVGARARRARRSRCSGRSRAARSSASPRWCCGRWPPGARGSAASWPARSSSPGRCCWRFTLWRPLIDERLAAKSKVATANVESREAYWRGRAADGRRPSAARRRAGPLRRSRRATTSATTRSTSTTRSRTTPTSRCWPRAACRRCWPSWPSSAARGGCSRGRGDSFQASEDADGLRLAAAVQASLVVAIVSANFLSVQITVPLWLLGGARRGARAAGAAPAARTRAVA